jgi:hypothetical protein
LTFSMERFVKHGCRQSLKIDCWFLILHLHMLCSDSVWTLFFLQNYQYAVVLVIAVVLSFFTVVLLIKIKFICVPLATNHRYHQNYPPLAVGL